MNQLSSVELNLHRQRVEEELHWRYSTCPELSVFTVHTEDPSTGRFTTEVYPNTSLSYKTVAQKYGGASYPVWSRMSVLPQNMQLQNGSRGTEKDTYGTSTLWVDIDPKYTLEDGTEDGLTEEEMHEKWKTRKLEELTHFQPRPTRVESSGRGLYALWQIPFTEDWERVKRTNKWLARQLDADSCWDVARLLRLPGTYNKRSDSYATVLKHLIYETKYRLDDFQEASLSEREERLQNVQLQPEPLPFGTEHQIQATAPTLWGRIYSKETALQNGAPKKDNRIDEVDRSLNDFYIACELLRTGLAENQVFYVLTHPEWFSGSKWRDKGYDDSYVTSTIIEASLRTPEEPMKDKVLVAEHIKNNFNLLYYGNNWFLYDDTIGYYKAGERELRLTIRALTYTKWSMDLEASVLAYLKEQVIIDNTLNTDYINCQNGMLDPKTGEIHDHHPMYQSLTQVNAKWDKNVDTSEVDEFVGRVLTEEQQQLWWMFNGYCLYTQTPLPYRCLFVLEGRRRTGKSTLLRCLEAFLGEANVSSLPLSDLSNKDARFSLSGLVGKLLNSDSEADYNTYMRAIDTLKQLAEGSKMRIERKYHDGQDVRLPVKFAFAMNEMPKPLTGSDSAFYDRWIIVSTRKKATPFEVGDPRTVLNADRRLLSVERNRAAWLKRSVEGLKRLHSYGGFVETPEMKEAKQRFKLRDPFHAFWHNHTEPTDEKTPQHFADFYNHYKAIAFEDGEKPITRSKFLSSTKDMIEEGELPSVEIKQSNQLQVWGRKLKGGIRMNGMLIG